MKLVRPALPTGTRSPGGLARTLALASLLLVGSVAAGEPTDAPVTLPSPEDPAPEPSTPPPGPAPAPVAAPTRPVAAANFVALVIGLSSYEHLPDEVELDFARSDAATVARALRENALFNEVFLLADGEAKHENILDLLRTRIAQLVGPNDVFLLYLVGHGIGADLGLPVLLVNDSTLENGQEDGLELQRFARDLQTYTPAGTTLIVTDAIHRNQLDGIYFYGPSASDWPRMSRGTMIVSASQSETAGVDGAFGKVFAEAISGAADTNRDKMVTAAELFTRLMNQLSPTGQIPVATGDFDTNMVVARNVRLTPESEPLEREDVETARPEEPVKPPEPKVIYPDYEIAKAKFVWRAGAAQTVQCREEKIVACDPSCYIYGFKAGPCGLNAVFDGTPLKGETVVLGPGLYECGRVGGSLKCEGK